MLPAFAAQGLEGVTTQELAKAAGVSEALLYKHFPGEEALYECIQACHMKKVMDEEVQRVHEMKPGSARPCLEETRQMPAGPEQHQA